LNTIEQIAITQFQETDLSDLLIQKGQYSFGMRLKQCGQPKKFVCRKAYNRFGCHNHTEYIAQISCDVYGCTICERKRLRYKLQKPLISVAKQLPAYAPQRRFKTSLKFVTLTERPYQRITKKTIDTSYQNVIKLLLDFGITDYFCGFEIVPSDSQNGTFYLHWHILVNSPIVPQESLSKAWESLTGNPIVYITAVKGQNHVVSYITKLTKYITKGQPNQKRFTNEQTAQLIVGLKGVRRYRAKGCFSANKKYSLMYQYRQIHRTKGHYCCPSCNSSIKYVSQEYLINDPEILKLPKVKDLVWSDGSSSLDILRTSSTETLTTNIKSDGTGLFAFTNKAKIESCDT